MKVNILILPLLLLNFNSILSASAVTFVTSLGTTTSINEKYSVEDRNGIYDIPLAGITQSTNFNKSNNLITNGDFELGTVDWPYVSGSGFVTDYQSGANHAGKYLWGRSTPGFTVHQLHDISFYPSVKYVECIAEYGGWANRDVVRILTKYKDAANVDLGITDSSPFFTGQRLDLFKTLSYTKPVPATTVSVDFLLEEKRFSGSDSDGYLDNIELYVWPDTFISLTPGANNNMRSLKFTLPVTYLGDDGNDIIQPKNKSEYSEHVIYKGGNGNDYLIMPNGSLNEAYGDSGDDVIISYMGADIGTSSIVSGGAGNDKIYAPLEGAGHVINGNSGNDLLVLRGLKTDYTFNYIAGTRYTITKANGLNLDVQGMEAFSFTNDSPLSAPNGTTKGTEDLWAIDTATHTLTDIFPQSINANFKSVQLDKTAFSITNDGVTGFNFYITLLPNSIIRLEDNLGNKIVDTVTNVNGLGETRTTAQSLTAIGGVDYTGILVSERDLVNVIPDDYSQTRITRSFQ